MPRSPIIYNLTPRADTDTVSNNTFTAHDNRNYRVIFSHKPLNTYQRSICKTAYSGSACAIIIEKQ